MIKLINIIVASLILFCSVYSLYIGIPELIRTFSILNSMSDIPTEFMDDTMWDGTFDNTNWTIRWILFTVVFTLWGFVGLIASINLFRNKRWASMTCFLLFLFAILHDALYSIPGVAKYVWEITEPEVFWLRLSFNLPICIYFIYKYKNYKNDAEQGRAAGSPGQALLSNRRN